MRQVYDLGVITEDFILVSGDVVSNMNIKSALEAHKCAFFPFFVLNLLICFRERRAKDKHCVMTTIFKKVRPLRCMCCVLRAVCCALCAARCVLRAVCCALCALCALCVLCAVCCALFALCALCAVCAEVCRRARIIVREAKRTTRL
jgi:hypothetical protein